MILTKEQAEIVSKTCEFYARIRWGQYEEIIWNFLDFTDDTDTICHHKDLVEWYLFEARKVLYPDLYGRGHSYGVGKFKGADLSYAVYQAIREQFGDHSIAVIFQSAR